MQTPEKFAESALEDERVTIWEHDAPEIAALADLIRARDAEVRADERGRCSVVHATLTDDALVAELMRRGVLEVDEYAEPCGWRCYVVTYDYDECRHVCRRSGPHAEHECVNGHTVAVGPDDDQPESTLRYVTEWEPDTDEGGAP